MPFTNFSRTYTLALTAKSTDAGALSALFLATSPVKEVLSFRGRILDEEHVFREMKVTRAACTPENYYRREYHADIVVARGFSLPPI